MQMLCQVVLSIDSMRAFSHSIEEPLYENRHSPICMHKSTIKSEMRMSFDGVSLGKVAAGIVFFFTSVVVRALG